MTIAAVERPGAGSGSVATTAGWHGLRVGLVAHLGGESDSVLELPCFARRQSSLRTPRVEV